MKNIIKNTLLAGTIISGANSIGIDKQELAGKCQNIVLAFEDSGEIINKKIELSEDGKAIIGNLIIEIKGAVIRIYTPFSDDFDESAELIYNGSSTCSLGKRIKND